MEIINEALDEEIRTVCLEQRIDNSDLCSLGTSFIHKSLCKKTQNTHNKSKNKPVLWDSEFEEFASTSKSILKNNYFLEAMPVLRYTDCSINLKWKKVVLWMNVLMSTNAVCPVNFLFNR